MATHRTEIDDTLDDIKKLARYQWSVEQAAKGNHWVITNPDGERVSLFRNSTLNRRGWANKMAALRRLGLDDALRRLELDELADRRSRLDAARADDVTEPSALDVLFTDPTTSEPADSNGHTPPMPSVTRGMLTRTEQITPERARWFLAQPLPTLPNGTQLKQRRIVDARVDRHKAAILAQPSRWLLMPDGIAIAPGGGCLNGQHRLTAIIETGVAVPVRVTYNVDPETFIAQDTGANRDGATMQAMQDEKNAYALHSACKLLHNYVSWRDGAPGSYPAWSTWHHTPVAPDLINATKDQFPTIRDHVREALTISPKPKLVTASVAVFRQIASDAWPDGADRLDEFCGALHTGAYIGEGHPAYTLREWSRMHTKGYRNRREVLLLLLVKCWNAFVTNKQVFGIPKHGPEVVFPAPYSPRREPAAT